MTIDPATASTMQSAARHAALLLALAVAAALAGCGSRGVYHDEAFRPDAPFSRRIVGSEEAVCGSVTRALLDQGYSLEAPVVPDTVVGAKMFQRDEQTVTLRLQTSCLDNNDGSWTVFANAQQETSELQALKQPAGITVGPIGGITVPTGSARFPVTVKRETVQDADFYARFFRRLEALVKEARPR